MRESSGRAPVVCWGEVLWDMFPEGPQLGGSVANVAYHLARLGAPVRLISRVGDDELGREARSRLESVGVDVSAVQVDRLRPTGRVNVELVAGEPRYSLSARAAWEHIEHDAAARAAIDEAAYLCAGTLVQRSADGKASLDAALDAAPASCRLVVDANVRPIALDHAWLQRTLARAQVVKLNEAEAELLGRELGSGDAISWLHRQGVELVALTRGAEGCELHPAGAAVVKQSGVAASTGGDNVGAGDSFVAVLIAGLAVARPLPSIADAANRYAAGVASCRGATPWTEGLARIAEEFRRARASQ